MKPIKLEISAFGPYKNKIDIDFESLGSNGVFLITGDTGSGKTTIFDAISFALYGNASGSKRETVSFRSDFASDDVKTFVKFNFLHKGIIYEIERIPRYTRKKIRGDGVTTVGGDASITYEGNVITGDKNVTEKCTEILGINANQFKQIVMIAQGEFMDLLFAKPKDRADILRHIFDTSIYRNISELLKTKYREIKREYEDCKLSINSFLASIELEEEIDISDNSIEDVMSLLEIENKKDMTLEKDLEEKKIKIEKDISILTSKITEGKLVQESLDNLNENKELLNKLMLKEDDYNSRRIIVNKSKEIWNKVISKKNELDELIEKCNVKKEELDENKKLYTSVKDSLKKISDSYNNLDLLRNKTIEIKDNIKKCEDNVKLFKEYELIQEEMEYKNKCLNLLNLNKMLELSDRLKKYHELDEKLCKAKKELEEDKDRYINDNNIYLDNYNLFLSSQAGILAKTLKMGKPCPVCGSLEHPKKAVYNDKSLSKEILDNEKKKLDKLKLKLDNKVNDINVLDKECSLIKQELNNIDENKLVKDIEKLSKYNYQNVDVNSIDLEELLIEITELEIKIREEKKLVGNYTIDDINKKIEMYKKKLVDINNEINDIQSKYNDINQERIRIETSIDLLEKEIASLDKEINIKSGVYKKSYQDLGYEDEKTYKKIVLSKEKIIEYEKDIGEYEDNVRDVKSKISTLKEVIKNKKSVDIDKLIDKNKNLNIQIDSLNLSLKDINTRLSNNLKIYNNIINK